MGHPAFAIPAGNGAEWVGSILAGGSLVGLVIGLRNERQARRTAQNEAFDQRRRAQATMVGSWIEPITDTGGADPTGDAWRLFVVNSSELPIRRVIGYVFTPDGRLRGAFLPIPVVPPRHTGTMDTRLDAAVRAASVVIAFNDEATLRWRKHMHAELELRPPGVPDIDPGDKPG